MRDSATGACIDPPPGTAAPGKGSGDPNQCATNRGAGGAWGNPFNVESGNKFERVVDIPATGGVMPLEFVRYYNSELSYWTHSYSRSLLQASGTKLVLTEDDGRARPFWLQPDGTYLSNPDARSDRIETILSGSTVVGWRRSTGDHIEEYTRYVQSGDASGQVRGRLANVTNRAGMQTQLVYPSISTGFPTQVQQRIGAVVARHLDIAWTGSGIHQRPTSVKGSWNTSSTPDVTFEYNTPHSPAPHFTPGRIVYRDGDGSSSNDPVLLYTYLWFGDRPRLTNVRTALGPANATPQSIASWTYDAAGRATGSYHGANLNSHSATYNQDGTVTVTNPLGRSFTVALGVQHGTSKVTAVEGDDVNVNGFFCGTDVRSVTYDSNGYIDRQTNRRGFVTDFDYDAEGRLVRRVEGLAQGGGSTPSTRSLDITWHPQFRSRTIEDEATQRRTYTYDALGLLERAETLDKVANVTRVTEYGYSSIATAKVLTSVDGPRGDVSDITHYTYANANDTAVPSKYRIGDLVSMTNALGQVTSYEYDLRGFPTVISEPSGLRTELTWDARGRLVSRRVRGAADAPGTGALTSFTYDAKNNVLLRVDFPDATSQRFEYDSALRVTAVVDGAGHRQVTAYDAAGNIMRTEKREQVGAVSTLRSAVDRVYDAMDRLRRISGAGGRTLARYDYDAEGNLTLEQDGESHSILHEYDALDRLARSIYPSATGTPDTRLAYDTLDEVTLASDLNANSTGHEVDGFGQVTRIQSPDSGVTTMQYDLAGNLTRRDHADGTWDLFTYDALNRRTFAGIRATTANPQGTTRFRYVYDETSSYGVPNLGIGRLTQVYAEPGTPPWVGRWSIYHYDARGNIVRVRTQVQAGTGLRDISYAYDLADKLTQVTYSNGRIVDYALDALGRVSGVSTRANAAAAPVMLASQIDWLPFGPMRSITLGNGIVTTWTWDADERLTRILSGSVLDRQYGYSLRDDIVSDGTRTYAYTADALARLTSDTPLAGGPTTQWTYDANGNRLTQVR